MTDTRHHQGEADAAAVAKTANRVTLDHVLSRIAAEDFYHPPFAPHVTVCALHLINGFVVIGKSAPADPENFNADLGRKIARDQAIAEIWGLEGYLLRERLHSAAKGAKDPNNMIWDSAVDHSWFGDNLTQTNTPIALTFMTNDGPLELDAEEIGYIVKTSEGDLVPRFGDLFVRSESGITLRKNLADASKQV